MSVMLQKLNQIRKKVKEREGILQNGNYYDLEDAEMSSFHSVTGLLLEWTSADNEVRECPLSVQVKNQLGRKDGLQNSDCLKSTQ